MPVKTSHSDGRKTPGLALIYGCLKHPRSVIGLALAGLALLSLGVLQLTVTTNLRVYFSADNPQLAALQELEDKYRETDSLVFLIVPDRGDIYQQPILRLIHDLTEAGWRIPYAQRATSLSNYQYSRGQGDDLVTRAVITDADELTQARISEIRRVAAEERGLGGILVSRDGSLAVVTVLLSMPPAEPDASQKTLTYGQTLAQELARNTGATVMTAGSVANSVALGEAVLQDIGSLVIISYGVILVLLSVLLGSVMETLLVTLIIAGSVGATMGLFGWLGFVLSPTAGFVPSIVMTIAVADCVHVLVSYAVELGHGRDKLAAIRESLRINLAPIFVTSLTTAIGVLSLNLSDSPPYRDLGNMVAVGVAFAFVLSVTLLPALLTVLPVPKRSMGASLRFPIDRFASWIIRNQRALLLGGSGVLIAAAALVPLNQLTERWHEYFSESFEIRRSVDLLSERLGGIHRLYYDLETSRESGVLEPEYVRQVEAFARWYEAQPGVLTTAGLNDTIKALNQALHENQQAYAVVPDSRPEIAQYLLLYELSLPLGAGVDNLVDQDRSASRFTALVNRTDSEMLLNLDQRATAWLANNAPDIEPRPGTGLDLIFAHITQRNVRGLLVGTAGALVAISLVLMVVLRSVRLGLVSLLPNLAPATLAYGLWGLGVGYIDMALSVVICMSLGIVVDDTVHFLSKYFRARRERGLDAPAGIHYAFRTVGMALATTSIVLVGGFGVLIFSQFMPTRETGTLLAITIALALVVDFLMLPPLLLAVDRRWPQLEKRT